LFCCMCVVCVCGGRVGGGGGGDESCRVMGVKVRFQAVVVKLSNISYGTSKQVSK